MAARITPRLVDLTYEAALRSYWRTNALRKFLRASNVEESLIMQINTETKRNILDRVFEKLQETDRGKTVIFQMAKNLSEQSSFPDLRGWEDSSIKTQDACKAVQELSSHLKQQNEEITNEKNKKAAQEQSRKEREKIQRTLTDRSKLKERLDAMNSNLGNQAGGYEFEKWFYNLLDFCEIINRSPYKNDGRQIDGSLTHDGTTYLVELKFTQGQSVPADIDSLKAKVNKMADNTMGIMVSISGYSEVAIKDASGSKTTLLIFDASHLYLFLTGAMSFADIISRVRRNASQTGKAYLSANKFNG